MNWPILIALLIGMVIGIVLCLCWIEWLDATRENRRRRMMQEPDSTRILGALLDDPLRPLDAHHPEVMKQAQQRRSAQQERIRKELDAMHKRGKK